MSSLEISDILLGHGLHFNGLGLFDALALDGLNRSLDCFFLL